MINLLRTVSMPEFLLVEDYYHIRILCEKCKKFICKSSSHLNFNRKDSLLCDIQ